MRFIDRFFYSIPHLVGNRQYQRDDRWRKRNFLLTKKKVFDIIKCVPENADVAHLVERHLAKVEVASSSLVVRSSLESAG